MAEPSPQAESEADDVTDSFSAYQEYNKILRTWFVAFGIGGPALLLVNEKVAERLKLGELKFVATLFLVGAVSQISGALVNKFANWYQYRSSWKDADTKHWKYKAADWLVDQFWIDIGLDLITVLCFGAAAWQLLTTFAPQG